MQDPNTIIMIHETMIQEEMQRNDPGHHLALTERTPGRGAVIWLRAATARTLFAVGDRIAPLSRQAIDPCAPATSVSRSKRRLKTG